MLNYSVAELRNVMIAFKNDLHTLRGDFLHALRGGFLHAKLGF